MKEDSKLFPFDKKIIFFKSCDGSKLQQTMYHNLTTEVKIFPLYLFKTVTRMFPSIPQEITSPIPTVNIKNGIGSATPYA